MRVSPAVLALSLGALVALSVPAAAAESTRTLQLELAPTGRFMVENLAGTMRVTSGSGDKVVAVATVHAEDDQVLGTLRFEQVVGEEGVPTLRVIYPTDRYTTFRYPGSDDGSEGSWSSGWLKGWLGGSSTNTKYAGRKVRVSGSGGVLLYADVEVRLPPRAVEGHFRNVVGRIDGRDVEGTLMFDSGSGNVTLARVKGSITADTGSGNVKAVEVAGSFNGDTGSGDVDLDRFDGDAIRCDTGSGDVRINSGTARTIQVDTGSGDLSLRDIDAEEVNADTGSGDVTLETRGSRLAKVKADTGSGRVTMRLGADASFEAMADLGSGDIVSRYRDAEPIVKDKEIVGYRRGAARIRIDVGTGSGDFVLEPGS